MYTIVYGRVHIQNLTYIIMSFNVCIHQSPISTADISTRRLQQGEIIMAQL